MSSLPFRPATSASQDSGGKERVLGYDVKHKANGINGHIRRKMGGFRILERPWKILTTDKEGTTTVADESTTQEEAKFVLREQYFERWDTYIPLGQAGYYAVMAEDEMSFEVFEVDEFGNKVLDSKYWIEYDAEGKWKKEG